MTDDSQVKGKWAYISIVRKNLSEFGCVKDATNSDKNGQKAVIDCENLQKSLKHLELQIANRRHAQARPELTDLDREGIAESVIQGFEICHDTLWKDPRNANKNAVRRLNPATSMEVVAP